MPSTPTATPVETANSYVTIAEADTYLDDSVRAAAWEFLSDDDKARALLTATRLLDRMCWCGDKADDANTLEWPRTGVVDKYGTAVTDTAFPDQITSAAVELGYELSQDAKLETTTTSSNTKRLKAGSVEIERFKPGPKDGSGSGAVARFPLVVQELIGQFISGGSVNGGGTAYGTDETSQFDDCDTYGRSNGVS